VILLVQTAVLAIKAPALKINLPFATTNLMVFMALTLYPVLISVLVAIFPLNLINARDASMDVEIAQEFKLATSATINTIFLMVLVNLRNAQTCLNTSTLRVGTVSNATFHATHALGILKIAQAAAMVGRWTRILTFVFLDMYP
jgi:hypothetical protein